MTIIKMLEENARVRPEKTAIIHKETRISYGTLREKVGALTRYLIDAGIEKGDRVGLLLEKSPEAIISFLGVAAAGGVVFPVDFTQPPAHIGYILNLTDPFAMIVDEKFTHLLGAFGTPLPGDRIIAIGEGDLDGFRHWDDLFAQSSGSRGFVRMDDDDPVYLNFTSGTTGMPKAAITTHAHIYWNTRAAVEALNLTREDVHVCMFPVFIHPHELLARPLFLGGTMVLVDSIYPKSIVKTVVDNDVTCMMAIASIYEAIVRACEISPFNLGRLRLAESGGMYTNTALAGRFGECFGIPIVPVWGSTETTGIALANPVDSPRPGSMGRPCPKYEARVVDEEGSDLPPGETGEMIIRGPGVCGPYFGNPEETAWCMKDGWYFTGDLVRKDEDGFYYFIDRKSRMMKVAGMKVFPSEIEEVLKSHPGISEVAVLNAQDRLHGEVPRAVIVTKKGVSLDKTEIIKFCEEKLAKPKIPRVVEFRDELPKTPGGKILWRQL